MCLIYQHISQKDFKIIVICRREYRREDGSTEIDRTLKDSLLPSIHIGNLIEFKGFGYRPPRYSSEDINFVEPKTLKQTDIIEMDRHHIRIMPPTEESVKRYKIHVEAENEVQKGWERWDRKWKMKSWINDRMEEIKKNWITVLGIIVAVVAIIVAIIIA